MIGLEIIFSIAAAALAEFGYKVGKESLRAINKKWIRSNMLPTSSVEPDLWDMDEIYENGSIVEHNKNYYVCIKPHNAALSYNEPGRNPQVWHRLDIKTSDSSQNLNSNQRAVSNTSAERSMLYSNQLPSSLFSSGRFNNEPSSSSYYPKTKYYPEPDSDDEYY